MLSEVEQEKKMEAARLALDAAYRPGLTPVPPVENPKLVIDFLHYHAHPIVSREDRIRAVSSTTGAIGSIPDNPTSQSGTWDMGGLLAGFKRGIERVKGLEGAAAVVALEEAYGRLGIFIDDWNEVGDIDEFLGAWTGLISSFLSSPIHRLRLLHNQPMSCIQGNDRQFPRPPLTIHTTVSGLSLSAFSARVPGIPNHFIPRAIVKTFLQTFLYLSRV